MSIAINSNFERDQLVCSFTGQTVFTYSFPIFSQDYLTVYQRGATIAPNDSTQQLTLAFDYTVQGVGEEAGGTITLTVGAIIGDIITIVGTEPIDRLSVFQDLNPFTVALNQQLNALTVMVQQVYTYWNHITPRYNFDELISNEVRPFKRILPMLPNGHVWVGRGEINQVPDDIVTAFLGGSGSGNVIAAHPGMRPSIVLWTGTDFIITDSDINIGTSFFERTAGATEDRTGFDDEWGAMHWPAHGLSERPVTPENGDTYYDTTTNQFFGFLDGVWVPFSTGVSPGTSTSTITQPNHGLLVGNWIRVNGAGLYVKAQADDPEDAEVIGVVIIVQDINTFTVQQSGYVETSSLVFTGLTVGGVYFLSTIVPGAMMNTDAVINGQVSRPVFVADKTTSGWVVPYRGLIVGGAQPSGPPGPAPTNPSIVPINQAGHGLIKGDVVRLSGSVTYVKAQANSLANAQAVGVVIQVIDANNFILQTDAYNVGALTADDLGNPLVAAHVYYLSSTVAGKITLNSPTGANTYSKPIYVSEQVFGTTGIDAGYIMEQRPLDLNASNPNIQQITQAGHGFIVGDWIYVSADSTFAKGIATALDTSQVVGVVIDVIDANTFILQTNGFIVGAVTVDDAAAPIVSAVVYYLSATVAGQLTGVAPSGATQYTKPLYVQEISASSTGIILEQRPLGQPPTFSNPNLHTVTQAGHGFVAGDWLYISGDTTYTKGIATSLAASQVVGVVVQVVSVNVFVIQTNGYNTGAVTVDGAGNPLVPGVVMYLSTTVAGRLQNTNPVTVGQVSKPCYVQEHTADHTGDILEQRPILIAPTGSGGFQLITTIAINNQASVIEHNLFNGTYQDITIIFRNVICKDINLNQYVSNKIGMQFELGGVLRTNVDYLNDVNGSTLKSYAFVTQGANQINTSQSGNLAAPGGNAFNARITMQGIDSATAVKSAQFCTWAANYPSGDAVISTNFSSSYGFSTNTTLPLTGFKFFIDGTSGGPAGPYVFWSGTISVYGTQC
jgi:hypothetical protein